MPNQDLMDKAEELINLIREEKGDYGVILIVTTNPLNKDGECTVAGDVPIAMTVKLLRDIASDLSQGEQTLQ